MALSLKPLRFIGSSRDDLRVMSKDVRAALGAELMLVQAGLEPSDFKPMHSVGAGAHEIRYRDGHGAFRVIYVAKIKDAVYVLHAFQKKAQKTPRKELDLAEHRYRLMMKMTR